MNHVEHLKTIDLDGGVLCLNFINTVSDYTVNEPINYIETEEDWMTWLMRVDIISEEIEFRKGSFDLKKIIKIRSLLHDLFVHYIHNETFPHSLISSFNHYMEWANRHLKIAVENGRVTEYLDYDRNQANNYLIPIIKSAKDLLVSDSLKNIKECCNCGWVYLDKSKNQTRRWCNMKSCGNKIKTQKYYRRSSSPKDTQKSN